MCVCGGASVELFVFLFLPAISLPFRFLFVLFLYLCVCVGVTVCLSMGVCSETWKIRVQCQLKSAAAEEVRNYEYLCGCNVAYD